MVMLALAQPCIIGLGVVKLCLASQTNVATEFNTHQIRPPSVGETAARTTAKVMHMKRLFVGSLSFWASQKFQVHVVNWGGPRDVILHAEHELESSGSVHADTAQCHGFLRFFVVCWQPPVYQLSNNDHRFDGCSINVSQSVCIFCFSKRNVFAFIKKNAIEKNSSVG